MADTVKLRTFNLSEALNGAILATSDTGDTDGKPKEYALYFQRIANAAYSAKINKVVHHFNSEGLEIRSENQDNTQRQLFIVDTTINTSTGSGGTRSDGDTIAIDSLQPRDLFANAALQALLNRIDNPLEIDETTIKLLAQKAYLVGAAMMNVAADYRNADTKTDETTTDGGTDGTDATTDDTDTTSQS